MLAHLRIEDFALIEALELDLLPGLNILTGETGAGKSILVDAVGLLRGGRADPAVIRTGAESARIEALFHVSDDELALLTPILERLGIDPPDDGDLVVRRVISRAGKSKVYVGGSLVALSSLVEVGRALVDLSGQHEHQGLSDPATHLEILDAYGDLGAARVAMEDAHTALQSAARTLALASSDERSRADREDLLRFQLQELEAVNPQAGEDARLTQERDRLKHAERLSSAAQRGSESLYSGQGAVGDVLVRVAKELAGLQEIEPRLGAIALELQSARVQIEEAARELGHYADAIEADPVRLAFLDERLHAISRLCKKHGGSLEALLQRRAEMTAELEGLSSHEARRAAAEEALTQAQGKARKAALALRRGRQKAARKLGEEVCRELSSLGMSGAQLSVECEPLGGPRPDEADLAGKAIFVDGERLGQTGADRVEFLLAANPGEEARPLQRVASGGELSRVMLALKRILAKADPVATYVFDEVDTGIGGATAEIVGRKIGEVAQHHQVLCVTHLPQIACFADAHFRVEKQTGDDARTRAQVRRLTAKERTDEVARMLGGSRIGEKARAHAQEMLRQARQG